jgi:ribosomal protein S18 acetylase RimI-like enzyme
MSSEIRIEPGVASDAPTIASLLAAQFAEHAIDLGGEALRAAIAGVLEVPSRGTFLLARAEAPIGLAYLGYTWTLEHGGKTAWLEELYVVPEARDRGVGTRLLRAAIDRARADGCAAMDLEIEADHARAAHLYAREGFRAHARARWMRPLR